MTANYSTITAIVLLIGATFIHCKEDWLEAKPEQSLVVPSKLEDYRALLDNTDVFGASIAGMGEAAADDSYITQSIWSSLTRATYRNLFVWADDVYSGETSADWFNSYREVMQANVVLDGLQSLSTNSQNLIERDILKGEALFHRSRAFYGLTQVFCKPYDPALATTDLGLPLKITSDVNEIVMRSSLAETYGKIITDLEEAYILLPSTSLYKTRPNKHAVLAFLARIYLSMENYDRAFYYADQSLKINSKLLDYNELDTMPVYPVPKFNDEIVFFGKLLTYPTLPNYNGIVDTVLYGLYEQNDLRKQIFFGNGTSGIRFTGNYSGERLNTFCGVANDELYLIRAECHVRLGRNSEGMDDLKTLLEKRYLRDENNISTYQNANTGDSTELLTQILRERRKELICRGVRWSDLRRLNKDPRFQISLTRHFNGTTYTLLPNDPKYTFLIPPTEILRTGMEQNTR